VAGRAAVRGYKWLLFELPCTHTESTIIQLSCTHSFVPSSTAVAASADNFNEKCISRWGLSTQRCALFKWWTDSKSCKKQQKNLRCFVELSVTKFFSGTIINWIKCPKSIAFHLSLQRDNLKGGSEVLKAQKAKLKFTPFFTNAYRGREKQCKLLWTFYCFSVMW
jgi:hypothetical protein